ncbi:MAG TPA: P-type conjugative transfer protein TrbL [Thermoanaerobaculia bacterium]|nr:P-type conjugative transfer protein TrbL [Thermoanaerobaculia bacterium]
MAAGAAVALALLVPAAAGAQAPQGGILDQIVGDYQGASAGWLERIVPVAQRTFAVLAALEFAVSGIWWALGREALDAALAGLLKKFMVLAFLYALISAFPLWVPAITAGFEAAGQAAAGSSAVNPSQLLDLGIVISSNMLQSYSALGLLTNPAGTLLATASALLVFLAYVAIAARICLVLVETYLVLTGGCLFLGFAGCRITAPFAEGYLLYAVQVGVKIYLIYLLAAVGAGLSRQWALLQFGPQGQAAPSLALGLQVLGGALIFCLLVWRIPSAVASRLTQGASLRLGEALR